MIPHYRFADDIELYNIGDAHRGDKACDVSLFLKVIEEVRRNPFARWVSTGDLANVALQGSKSGAYYSDNVGQEVEDLSKELAPIADKCLGFVESNHHDRFDRAVGMSLDKLLASFLQIPFLGSTGRIVVTCGKASYWISMHHGVGGGRTTGAKANIHDRLMDLSPCFDLMLSGHTHTYLVSPSAQVYPDRKRITVTTLQQWRVTTGHFLDYDASYAGKLMLREMPKGAAVCHMKSCGVGQTKNKQIKSWLFS